MKKFLTIILLFGSLSFGDCSYDKAQMVYFYNLYTSTQNPYDKTKFYEIYLSYWYKVKQQNCQ